MDLPDAYSVRDRGLPLDHDPPSVRLLRPSDPYNDLEHGGSLDAVVTVKESDTLPLPASPGIDVVEDGAGRFPLQD